MVDDCSTMRELVDTLIANQRTTTKKSGNEEKEHEQSSWPRNDDHHRSVHASQQQQTSVKNLFLFIAFRLFFKTNFCSRFCARSHAQARTHSFISTVWREEKTNNDEKNMRNRWNDDGRKKRKKNVEKETVERSFYRYAVSLFSVLKPVLVIVHTHSQCT